MFYGAWMPRYQDMNSNSLFWEWRFSSTQTRYLNRRDGELALALAWTRTQQNRPSDNQESASVLLQEFDSLIWENVSPPCGSAPTAPPGRTAGIETFHDTSKSSRPEVKREYDLAVGVEPLSATR